MRESNITEEKQKTESETELDMEISKAETFMVQKGDADSDSDDSYNAEYEELVQRAHTAAVEFIQKLMNDLGTNDVFMESILFPGQKYIKKEYLKTNPIHYPEGDDDVW
eukprot:CAMPEP_0177587332 /NCGR_PEP_ID=MMETSP0419_2-20121207/5583_1 /TAXON_ID=582737 /ORGANISM="Tetraselmis sp., Strain GSL018" /LENGTH=108 /DNA_ID=CAMNT_0019077351 /DNA_START=2136 /DNA_END=2459 /DNA_ORIENTATION=+